MKKIFFLVFFLIFFQGLAWGKGLNEKELRKKAKELSYTGQLDRANEMIGDKTDFSSGKPEAGWDMNSMMLAMVWGSIGTGYFLYGKKQTKAVFLLCGIGLCVFPMFVSGNVWSVVLGLAFTIAPFKLEI